MGQICSDNLLQMDIELEGIHQGLSEHTNSRISYKGLGRFPKHLMLLIASFLPLKSILKFRRLSRRAKEILVDSTIASEGKVYIIKLNKIYS